MSTFTDKARLAVSAAVLCCAACSHDSAGLEPKGGPREDGLAVDGGPSWDFGMTLPDEELGHEFRFTNVSGHTLTLEDGFATCSCTHWDVPGQRWTPGESGSLAMTMSTVGRSGALTSIITLLFRDETDARWMTRFELAGTVEVAETVYAEPASVDFLLVPGASSSTFEVRTRILDKMPRVRPVEHAAPTGVAVLDDRGFEVEAGAFIAPEDPQEGEYVASLTLASGATEPSAGALQLRVQFSDGHARNLVVPVRIERPAQGLRASTPSLFLGALPAGAAAEKQVRILGLSEDAEVQMSTSDDWLVAEWRGDTAELAVDVHVPEAKGAFRGWVEVADAGSAVRIPVVGVAR